MPFADLYSADLALVEVAFVNPPPNLDLVEVTRDLLPVVFPPPFPVLDILTVA